MEDLGYQKAEKFQFDTWVLNTILLEDLNYKIVLISNVENYFLSPGKWVGAFANHRMNDTSFAPIALWSLINIVDVFMLG